MNKRFLTLRYIGLFAVLYFVLMFIVGLVIQTLEITPPSMSNILVIVGSVLLINAFFLRREKRPPSRNEYLGLVAGATLADFALEMYGLQYVIAPIQWGTIILVTLGHTLLFAVGFFPRRRDSNEPSAA
ncbi:ABZJ_00895 family protein [Geothrix oryzae]|uniref:ABZJ_00895 family protein n=1 Tax=Geothrix oryzae TaxID=2927975 RepID=UPI002573ADF6|nr:ABZJ_00895 family protein [Geothrix oryzae]